ncbi:Signal transduction histidine kinase [Marivirga sericea]|uniref:histidine kinase n=1 Tax=Marivirga sericea TaxID=1028 RepID=A0A1X7I9Z0_9BACT|nr:MASE1 domain-containing protein [Marivirga sericea]SMG10840.1 Signal transduction histidine kinase [Marivirga sericea]
MQLKAIVKYKQDLIILFVALGYFFFARLGYFLVFEDIYILPTWPPSGLALAFLILLGRKAWPGITIGALLANILAYWNTGDLASDSVILLSSVIAAGHTLEALLGNYLIEKWIQKDQLFNKSINIFRFLGVGFIIALVSAAIGTGALYYQGLFGANEFLTRFVSWWVGNLVGILLFTPFILSFKEPIAKKLNRGHFMEIIFFSLALVIVFVLLNQESLRYPVQQSIPFLVLPLLLWMAFRFHLSVAMTGTIIIGLISVYMTTQGIGPFVMETPSNAMLILQIFLGVISVSTIILSATQRERTEAQNELKSLNSNLEEIVQTRTKELESENATRKNAEQELKSSNTELRKINAELDNFVYRVSHDLRAPIASMLGLLNLAKSDESEEMKSIYLSKIEQSAQLQDTFITEILDQSRNARLEVRKEPIDFEKIIKESFEQLQYSNTNEDVEKTLNIDLKDPFYSDPWRLKVIINNVISNSIRYRNGKSPKIDIDISSENHEALINIKDNGRGIEQEHIDKVFNMFYRATDDNAGSGLGLYIVKETVSKLQGRVQIQSKPREGTTISFVLPNMKN